ncbi:putative methyltransferase PMT26 [Nicotiana tabacum]|uniref:Probable methyltransferase PMT26 n=2 Tax=Nicotiana TaxID=4085 RepID=A0A1S3ZFC4_TOBAC|nr:PREDICTED: probable methyltransferase PMT26 [Nicotiana sylvestris]XP_009771173.1 PREDICTED: probable methyltransferase PMT26 [Nicotiana sylvestris]XP_016462985.1 PREDICTED: probable methyltransferase PMT26 [Nicotiana tabacum]XP_016462986.1 PREDICTED: probable methyltransferase PMT26 [Nicotiana tabacum]
MALGKYSRVDGRKSSSYCSTVTIVVFVALCLVGVWMMTSSSVVPVQNSDVSSQGKTSDATTQVSESKESSNGGSESNNNAGDESNPTDEGKSKQFEDNPGDLPEDATKGDASVSQEENNSNSQQTESTTEVKQEEKSTEQNEETGDSKSETQSESGIDNSDGKKIEDKDSEAGEKNENKSVGEETEEGSDEKKSVENPGELNEKKDQEVDQGSDEKADGQKKDQSSNEVFPSGAQSDLLNETTTQNGAFSTQASESKNEKETQKSPESDKESRYTWKVCNSTAGPDYIPCLDNLEAIRSLRSTKHYEHRERHCPDNPPTCLVPLPEGYQRSVEWPTSREKIWYHNVPHTKLAEVKGHQNWVKVSGEYLTFPGGGTQFKHGALHYIDFIQQSIPDIAWGKRTRVILDVGCGVASFGGYLFDRDVLAMSLAPKDEHEAQVQFALERGIPAISAVMGTKRLPFPSRVFDVVHCARCRVPWHIEGGKLLLELNRLLRPGGLFVWSATPVYQKLPEDVEIWEAMKKLTKAMCWELISKTKDRVNAVGVAVYRKPMDNECYEQRSEDAPPLCQGSDDPNAAWNVPLQACLHKAPVATSERGSQWPESWPARLSKSPYWLLSSQVGVYGKPAPEDFTADYEHWKHVVKNSYINGMGINWSTVRNVMDMRAIYGGFAAALRDLNVWVMNIVSVDAPDTLPIIYERGLFGIYHDWCESFSTYPRSYDLLHADHLFSKIKTKCGLPAIVAEVDRILRPEGKLIVRDKVEAVTELESMFKSMHYEIRMTYSKDKEGLLCVQKTMWRPKEVETLTYALA